MTGACALDPARILTVEALDATVAAPRELLVVAPDGVVRHLDLDPGRVSRTPWSPASAGLLAAGHGRLVLGDAVRTRVVAVEGDDETALELPIHGLRAAAFATPTSLVTLGQRTVSRFDLETTTDGPPHAERAWTRLFSRLGRQLTVRRDGSHAAIAQTDAVTFVALDDGRSVDQMPMPAGLSGVAVDAAWRHWVVWRDGERAIQRCGRDERVGRWRFERVATGTLQPVAAAVDPTGRAWILGDAGQLAVHSRGTGPEIVAELDLPAEARPRRIDALDDAIAIVCTGRVILVRTGP